MSIFFPFNSYTTLDENFKSIGPIVLEILVIKHKKRFTFLYTCWPYIFDLLIDWFDLFFSLSFHNCILRLFWFCLSCHVVVVLMVVMVVVVGCVLIIFTQFVLFTIPINYYHLIIYENEWDFSFPSLSLALALVIKW